MLLEEFLKPMGLTQRELARALHVPCQRINEIVNGRRGMTPSIALRLEKFLGMSSRTRALVERSRGSFCPLGVPRFHGLRPPNEF
jgi:addiction module HigA family antidote